MLKRRDAPYLPGRPKGQWWKWKRDPHIIDAVLMYAQRGHGKRSSYYSDYTFGVWTAGDDGDELVPVGKAYFGFTDEELLQIDRFVRRNTTEKFGPVRHVVHEPDQGLVLEVAFEGLQRSTAAQIRRRDALSAHQPAALGQAAARGRPAGNAGADAEERDSNLRCRRRMAAIDEPIPGSPSALPAYTDADEDRRRDRCPTTSETCRPANDGLYRFLGGSPLCGGVPADPAVDPGRRGARRDRLRSLEYPAQHPTCCSGGSGISASTPSTGCGATSCSAP